MTDTAVFTQVTRRFRPRDLQPLEAATCSWRPTICSAAGPGEQAATVQGITKPSRASKSDRPSPRQLSAVSPCSRRTPVSIIFKDLHFPM
jgi:hypothetical protein